MLVEPPGPSNLFLLLTHWQWPHSEQIGLSESSQRWRSTLPPPDQEQQDPSRLFLQVDTQHTDSGFIQSTLDWLEGNQHWTSRFQLFVLVALCRSGIHTFPFHSGLALALDNFLQKGCFQLLLVLKMPLFKWKLVTLLR